MIREFPLRTSGYSRQGLERKVRCIRRVGQEAGGKPPGLGAAAPEQPAHAAVEQPDGLPPAPQVPLRAAEGFDRGREVQPREGPHKAGHGSVGVWSQEA